MPIFTDRQIYTSAPRKLLRVRAYLHTIQNETAPGRPAPAGGDPVPVVRG